MFGDYMKGRQCQTTWRIFPNSDPDPFSQAIVIVVVFFHGVVGPLP